MKSRDISPKIVLLGAFITMLVNVMGNLLTAILIQQSIMSFDFSPISVVLVLVLSSFVGSLTCVKKSGNQLTGYLSAAVVVLLFLSCALAMYWTDCSVAALTKALVAIFVGSFLGNFFGKLQHNKLRKMRKKRYVHTK